MGPPLPQSRCANQAWVPRWKDGETGLKILSRLKVVEVGVDEDGDAITSCVIEPVEEVASERRRQEKGWPKSLAIFKRALDFALCESGETIHPFADGPPVRGVKRDAARHEFLKIYPAETRKAKGVAFGRCVKDAVERALMVSRDAGPDETPYFWALDP